MIQSFEIPASDDNEAGFKAIHFRDSAISVLSRHPAVVSIEPNRAIRVDSMDLGPAAVDFALTASAPQPEFYKQLGAPWNLVRVSERKYGERDWYSYGSRAGTAVNVYVIDTGIFAGHEEFGGRAIWGKSFVDSEPQDDLNGHGSHVAGTVAGLTFGAAKNATVVAVKVLDANGGGSWSNVLAAIEWVVGDVQRTQDPSILQ